MRIENALLSQSLIESSQALGRKEDTTEKAGRDKILEDSKAGIPLALRSSGTYSVASLKAAVDYHAKFLTVAESNLQAVRHSSMIPQVILDRLNGRA